MAENRDIFDVDAEEEPSVNEAYGDEPGDLEENIEPITPPPEPAAKPGNQKMAMVAAGLVGTLALLVVGNAVYSKFAKPKEQYDIPAVAAQVPAFEMSPPSAPSPANASTTNPYTPTENTPAVAAPEPAAATAGSAGTASDSPVATNEPTINSTRTISVDPMPQIVERIRDSETRLMARIAALEERVAKIGAARPVAQPAPATAVSAQRPAPQKVVAKPEKPAALPPPDYLRVQATIVGQAWVLNTKTGRVDVVREGDTLPDGTVIRKISADKHMVSTNRGDLINE